MNYGINLFTTFDADLISLSAAGISVPYMIRKALEYRVRGKRAHFFVTGCVKYELVSRKRKYHITVKITDEESIRFLSTQIKPRQRSAFFRTIVREALINQSVGVYLRTNEAIGKEDDFIRHQDINGIENVFILEPKKKIKKTYAQEILRGSKKPAAVRDNAHEEDKKPDPGKFGDVEDLSLHSQKRKAEEEKKQEEDERGKKTRRTKKDAVEEEPVSEAEDTSPAGYTVQEDDRQENRGLPEDAEAEEGDTASEIFSEGLMNMFENM